MICIYHSPVLPNFTLHSQPYFFFLCYLSVHLDTGLAAKLPAGEVGVVRGVDVVVGKGLIHVLDR